MGTWGTSLYANDTTSDVRDTYVGFLEDQLNNDEALKKTMAVFQDLIGDEDEEPLLWYALAETQWKVGRLTKDVKERALDWIAKSGGINLWEENDSGSKKWMETLNKLKDTLESPMRSEKKIREPKGVNKSFWSVGDVYAYQFHKEESKVNGVYGKYIIIQKVGEGKYTDNWMSKKDILREPILMRIHIFDMLYDEIPALDDAVKERLLPLALDYMEMLPMTTLIDFQKKNEYPEKYLHYLGNKPIIASKIVEPESVPALWVLIENTFNYFSTLWKDREYEIHEDGSFCRIDSK